jgi:putative peptide zinc metalloprotease protein
MGRIRTSEAAHVRATFTSQDHMQATTTPLSKLPNATDLNTVGADPEPPALAPGVELVGEMPETGFQDQQWLALRGGQFVQLSELLFRICEQCDGRQSVAQIAEAVSDRTEWLLDAESVQLLIDKKLAPIGLVWADSAEVDSGLEAGTSSPLAVQLRTKLVGPAALEPVTRILQALFAPVILVPVLGLAAAAHVWLYAAHGISATVVQVLTTPGLLLLLLPILMLGLAFHELGHAAALRYGGGQARSMGVGLYLVFPAFFTNTTDAYRLGKAARVRTDLGGFYFHLIFALALIGAYFATGQEFLLLPVLLIDLDILYQCLPFVRLDGYWALADVTGIPDFFSLMGAFVASISRGETSSTSRLPALRPFARTVFLLYTLIVLPLLAVVGVFALTRLPWVLSATWSAELLQRQLLDDAFAAGNPVFGGLVVLQMLLLIVPVLGSAYLLMSIGSPVVRLGYRWITSR